MPNVAIIPTAAPTVAPLTAVVDGWPDETHAIKVNVGGAPVEDGVTTTDHSVLSNEEVTLTGWVSNWRGGTRTPAQAWAAIREMAREREPIRLITEWGVYPEMLIFEAEAPKTHRGMRFSLKFVWINRIGVPAEALPAESTRSDAVSAGTAEAVGEAQDVAEQVPEATIPVQALAFDSRNADPSLLAPATAVEQTTTETLSASSAFRQAFRLFERRTHPNIPSVPPLELFMRVATLLSLLQVQFDALATAVSGLPGTEGLSSQFSTARPGLSRLSRQATSAFSSLQSAQTQTAAFARTGEVARGRVPLRAA